MNPDIYKSLSNFCYPVDHEYDALQGTWTHQAKANSSVSLWLILISIFAASILCLVSAQLDLNFIF